jgi:hypothetical protein
MMTGSAVDSEIALDSAGTPVLRDSSLEAALLGRAGTIAVVMMLGFESSCWGMLVEGAASPSETALAVQPSFGMVEN